MGKTGQPYLALPLVNSRAKALTILSSFSCTTCHFSDSNFLMFETSATKAKISHASFHALPPKISQQMSDFEFGDFWSLFFPCS